MLAGQKQGAGGRRGDQTQGQLVQGPGPSQSHWPLSLGRQQVRESSDQKGVLSQGAAAEHTVERRGEVGRVARREEGGLGGAGRGLAGKRGVPQSKDSAAGRAISDQPAMTTSGSRISLWLREELFGGC